MDRIRKLLKRAGKGEEKVIAVFGADPEHCERAVRYVRREAPDLPVWLFTTREPAPETAVLCARVVVKRNALALLAAAERRLWPYWVALGAACWTGARGGWPLKLAPLLIPPFRALLMNEHGGFFAARPGPVARHARRRIRDAAHSAAERTRDLGRGAGLWCFAMAAKRSSALSRYALAHWRGARPLDLPALEPEGQGIQIFRYRHRWWNYAELQKLLRESRARWILFLEAGADERWEDLAVPFSDARTFAVTRQTHFRAWKPCLFPMAPFRALQAGEYSRTLAPVSTALLVDRRKLAALGVPRTIVPGTAWLLLFWQAAAAGWRAYSAAAAVPARLSELPDWPYEEAEFVTRLRADSHLRDTGPREAGLSRGSIACCDFTAPAPGPRSPAPGRVLIVSPYLPYPLSHGGAVRIYNLCRALAGRVEFLLACFRERNDVTDYARLREIFQEVYVVDRDERAAADPALPRQVREHQSRGMRALIAELCRTRGVDLLQIEYTHMAHFRDAAPRVPAILVEHDLTFTLYEQYAARDRTREACAEAARWRQFEIAQLARYDAVWVVSEEDQRTAVAQGSPAARTALVPNGVDLDRYAPGDQPGEVPEILYVGSFRHRPNVVGFEVLRREMMPLVWRRFPEARLRVVAGPEPERYCRAESNGRILIHGFVPDMRPLYARATVVAVPLLVSAGTNIKVLEAMACGKAVVSTPVGCAGLELSEGRNVLVRGEPAKFADAICSLLEDGPLRATLGVEARRTVERRFGWHASAEAAYASYRELLPEGGL